MNKRLTPDEAEVLTAELATASQASLPLDVALRAAADELGQSRFARVLHDMASSLEQGRSLPDVIHSQSGRLPRFLGGVISVAARTDRLEVMLPALVEQLEYQSEQNRRLRGAVA